MKTRAEIKKDAKRKLNAFWIVPVITVLVVYVLEALIIGMLNDSTLSSIFQVVITTIASVFTTTLFLNIAKNDDFDQVKFSWMKVLKCIVYTLLLSLATTLIQYVAIYSGVLLSFVLGICITVIEVYLSFSLLVILDTDAPIIDAAKQSINLVQGNFWNIIVLGLSFIGWFILGILPLGLGLLWVLPYTGITFANYYLELKLYKPMI